MLLATDQKNISNSVIQEYVAPLSKKPEDSGYEIGSTHRKADLEPAIRDAQNVFSP